MNKYSKQRKIISASKYMRIYNDNLDKVGCAMIYKSHDMGWKSSLSAVAANGFVYATFATAKQAGSRLSTYSVKYNMESPLHHVVFIPFPKPVTVEVEF